MDVKYKNYIYQKVNKINKLKKQEEDIRKNLHNYSSEDLSSIMDELETIENDIVNEVNEYLRFTNQFNDSLK